MVNESEIATEEIHSKRKYAAVNLERYQRIFLGLDDEFMMFSGASVGHILVEIGNELADDNGMFVRAVGDALLGRDEHHVVTIQNRRKGRFVTPFERSQRHREIFHVEFTVWQHLDLGLQMKAAVSRTGEIFGRSRAWVFAALREVGEFRESVKLMRVSMEFGLGEWNDDAVPSPTPPL